MWPRTDFVDLLGIEYPIVQAPMSSQATPSLAAAVSNAGGLGSLGLGTKSLEVANAQINELKAATNRPFNLNFFTHQRPRMDQGVITQIRQILTPFYKELSLGEVPSVDAAPFEPFGAEALALVLEVEPAAVSFHFGLPDLGVVTELKQAGCRIMCSATNVAEAKFLETAGVDVIIAQGWEAGGHSGIFDPSPENTGVGTMALVPQVVDAVSVPVLAAGGIADGRGIAAAFALGASGVQLGTAFLSSPEAQVSDIQRRAMRQATDQDTMVTRAFSGRPARAKKTSFVRAMVGRDEAIPDWPMMLKFTAPLRQARSAVGDENFQFLLYGQAAALNRELPAAVLLETLVLEAQEILNGT